MPISPVDRAAVTSNTPAQNGLDPEDIGTGDWAEAAPEPVHTPPVPAPAPAPVRARNVNVNGGGEQTPHLLPAPSPLVGILADAASRERAAALVKSELKVEAQQTQLPALSTAVAEGQSAIRAEAPQQTQGEGEYSHHTDNCQCHRNSSLTFTP